MTTRRALLRAASLAVAAPAIGHAQPAWPVKPITIVVNFSAGGLTDALARAFGQHVQQATGQQVIVDNKPGASGNIGAALVARAPADGYTFLHSITGTLVQNRVMFKSQGFDPDKDLVIVAGMRAGAVPVVVHKSVPAANLREFVEYARNRKVNWGSFAQGSQAHIFAQGLNQKFGLQIEVVTYKGEAPMWQDMGAGSLQAAMGSAQGVNALLVKGDVRPIATPGPVRGLTLPNVPTTMEQGFTEDAFQPTGWMVLAAPAATPREIVRKMSGLWLAAAESEPGRQFMASAGLGQAPMPHEEAMADYQRLKAKIVPLVAALGLTPE